MSDGRWWDGPHEWYGRNGALSYELPERDRNAFEMDVARDMADPAYRETFVATLREETER